MESKISTFYIMGRCLGTKSVLRLYLFVLRQKDVSVFLGYLQKMREDGGFRQVASSLASAFSTLFAASNEGNVNEYGQCNQ